MANLILVKSCSLSVGNTNLYLEYVSPGLIRATVGSRIRRAEISITPDNVLDQADYLLAVTVLGDERAACVRELALMLSHLAQP